jgi:DNA-binding CsgD family transcriptional regulator
MPRRVVKKLNSIGRIGRRGAMDRFDPNAVDGDDDGLVQEQTRFERPASPRISGSVSGRQMTPEMVERDKEIIRRRNEGQQTQQIADDMGITLPTVNYALHRGRKRGEVTYADNTNEPKPDRDAEIIKRFIAGESQPSIARDLGMSAATVGNVISRARKRGESIPFRERTKKKPDIAPKEAEPTFYESVAKLNDEGKSVAEIAQELNVKARDVIQALVQNRQTSEIEKRRRGIRGAVGPGRKESMQKYVDNPRLDIDAETIAASIGFWKGFYTKSKLKTDDYGPKRYNYANHPQFSYDLQTGKPVVILGSRTDPPANIEKIIKEGKYLIRNTGTYGLGANFAFDGDPVMGETYGENIGQDEWPGTLARVNRLIVKLNLRNPIVVNLGMSEGLEDFAYTSEMYNNARYDFKEETGPRETRIANFREQTNEFIKQLGGEDKVRGLYKKLLKIAEKEVSSNSSNDSDRAIERLNRYAKIVEGGDIIDISHQDFNRLARAAGHDAIVRLAIGHWDPDSSHIIVLDERSIKIVGKRPAYSKETVEGRTAELIQTMRDNVNHPTRIYPARWQSEYISRAIGNIEEMLLDKEANPDSWTEVDDNSIIRQANIILMYHGQAQAKIKLAKENNIETSEDIDKILEEGLEIALAVRGIKKRKGKKLSGSIRRPEPEVWEMPQEYLIPFDTGDYDNELEGGALYDEMIGPKPRVNRPNDRKPLTAESATQRRTALIAGGFVNLDDEIQVRDGKFVSQEAREAIARDFADDKLSMSEIAKKYKVSPSWIRKKFPEVSSAMSRNRRRNDSIRQDFLNGASLGFLSNKYDISPTHLRQNILSDLLKERGDGEDAQETYRDNARRRINRRTRKNSNKISKNKPNTSDSVGPNKDTEANVPTEPLVTPGGISGSMSNENFNVGLKLKTKTKISPLEDGLFQVDIDYGDLTINAEVDLDNYSSYKDAYDRWIDWDGNYGMRVASAALMGENLPEAWGYRGSDDGTHHHDVISTGVMASGARESLPTVEKQVTDALITLHHINTGKETNIRPIYRGVSNVTAGNELLSLGNGSVITMPLSAFTADRKVANMYATGMGKTNDGLILEVLPGARVGDAAGDQYLHRFDLIDDKGNVEGSAVDVTESITQGKFKFVGMSTILVPNQSGGNDSVKKITLEQIETFNPIKGSYEKNSGKLAGSMSSKRDQFLARVGEVRPITQGLVPGDVQSLQARAVEMYVQRSPILIKRLSDIEKNNSWQYATDAINPDGSRMSKEQYIAFKTNEIRQMGQQYASNRLNKQDPDTRPRHIEQLQHNVDLMFAASPELQMLCEQYGYPLYAIFNAQEVRDKDGKNVWKPNTEAHENNMAGLANGVTLWGLGISAIYPYSDDAFIPEGMPFGQAIQDPRRLLNGHWGIRPESYGTGVDTDPMSLHRLLIEQHMNQYEKLGRRPDITDVNTPLGTLRHETSHNIHSGAVARALLDVLENPSIENREKYALLTLLFKPNWQSAFAASAGNSKQVQMMYDQAVSDYAASSPPEWFAETLSAALSPSEKTRSLLNFNHRGILAIALPELREYLIEGDWP